MRAYYQRLSITVPGEDKEFIRDTAQRKRCSVSKLFQDIIHEYRKFDECSRGRETEFRAQEDRVLRA